MEPWLIHISAVVASFHTAFDELSLKVGEGFIESRTETSAKEIFENFPNFTGEV
jgi:hypothetical protein